jgi:hypothetical protein
MTDKSTLLRAFNNHFFDFLDDIITIVPDNDDIPAARTSFSTIKKANPTAIVKVWYKFIYSRYNDVIKNGDITFFFDKDYYEDINHLSNAENVMKIIDTIRSPIREMSDVNRGHTMKYIQNLTELSRLYSEGGI